MNFIMAQPTLVLLIVGLAACWCTGADTTPASAGGTGAEGAGAGGAKLVLRGAGGKLRYTPDEDGNVIPDFSNCGYRGGGVKLPDAPVKAQVSPDPKSSDDTARIQKAIDLVSKLPPGKDSLRGAVLLKRGRYRIGGTLNIEAGGVVLRGEGDSEGGTVLVATGKDQYDLIDIDGKNELREQESSRQPVTDAYVPVGARTFNVADGSGIKVRDTVIVRRTGNADWIRFIAMDRITPRPSDPSSTRQWQPFELRFDRVITAISGKRITVDAPLTCAIEAKWGGGSVT